MNNKLSFYQGSWQDYQALKGKDRINVNMFVYITGGTEGEGDSAIDHTGELYLGEHLLTNQVSAEDIAGLEQRINNLEAGSGGGGSGVGGHSFYEYEDALPDPTPEYVKPNDVAIVTVTDENSKTYKTAYYYKGNQQWAAMAGNYNATNIYFDSDIEVTQAVGNIRPAANGVATLKFGGRNLAEVWQYLYATDNTNVTATYPKIKLINTTKNSYVVEAGTSIAGHQIELQFVDGQYSYGSKDDKGQKYNKDDGAGITWTKAVITTPDSGTITPTDLNNNFTYSDNDVYIAGDGVKTYTYTATASHGAAPRRAISKLGNWVNSSQQIVDSFNDALGIGQQSNITTPCKFTIEGRRYIRHGSIADTVDLNSGTIRKLSHTITENNNIPTSITAGAGTQTAYAIAIPENLDLSFPEYVFAATSKSAKLIEAEKSIVDVNGASTSVGVQSHQVFKLSGLQANQQYNIYTITSNNRDNTPYFYWTSAGVDTTPITDIILTDHDACLTLPETELNAQSIYIGSHSHDSVDIYGNGAYMPVTKYVDHTQNLYGASYNLFYLRDPNTPIITSIKYDQSLFLYGYTSQAPTFNYEYNAVDVDHIFTKCDNLPSSLSIQNKGKYLVL